MASTILVDREGVECEKLHALQGQLESRSCYESDDALRVGLKRVYQLLGIHSIRNNRSSIAEDIELTSAVTVYKIRYRSRFS